MERGRSFVVRLVVAVAALAIAVGACGSTGGPDTESASAVDPPVEPTIAPTSTPPPTATSAPPAPTATPGPSCIRLADFDGADPGGAWRVVNDGVMGGRSFGETTFADGAMTFAGTIVTAGGGFSSVRLDLPLGGLDDATELRLRARTDGRSYEIVADDAVPDRDRRVSHFGAVPVAEPGVWEEVLISLGAMEARLFGTPVDDAPFDPAQATSIGVFLADGSDGAFTIDVDWIDACP